MDSDQLIAGFQVGLDRIIIVGEVPTGLSDKETQAIATDAAKRIRSIAPRASEAYYLAWLEGFTTGAMVFSAVMKWNDDNDERSA